MYKLIDLWKPIEFGIDYFCKLFYNALLLNVKLCVLGPGGCWDAEVGGCSPWGGDQHVEVSAAVCAGEDPGAADGGREHPLPQPSSHDPRDSVPPGPRPGQGSRGKGKMNRICYLLFDLNRFISVLGGLL